MERYRWDEIARGLRQAFKQREAKARRLLAQLRDDGKTGREAIIEDLARIGHPALGPAMQELRRGRSPHAAMVLERMGLGVVDSLNWAMRDEKPAVQSRLAKVVAKIQAAAKPRVPGFIRAMADEDQGVRSRAAKQLGYIGAQAGQAVQPLIEALGDKQWAVRLAVAEALAKIAPNSKGVQQALMRTARKDGHWWVRKAAAAGLLRAHPPVLDNAVEALRDNNLSVRMGIAWELGQLGPAAGPAIPALVKALGDENGSVRDSAARALGKIGPPARAALPALRKALTDKHEDTRVDAALSLWRLDPSSAGAALPVIVEMLVAKHPQRRVTGALVLGQMGPAAKKAIPALKEALKDEDEDVRKAAAEALKKIQAAPTT